MKYILWYLDEIRILCGAPLCRFFQIRQLLSNTREIPGYAECAYALDYQDLYGARGICKLIINDAFPYGTFLWQYLLATPPRAHPTKTCLLRVVSNVSSESENSSTEVTIRTPKDWSLWRWCAHLILQWAEDMRYGRMKYLLPKSAKVIRFLVPPLSCQVLQNNTRRIWSIFMLVYVLLGIDKNATSCTVFSFEDRRALLDTFPIERYRG